MASHHGLKYWKWHLDLQGRELTLEEVTIVDYGVLLPRLAESIMPGGVAALEGIYTIVTKEWSPALLDHFDYSKVGIIKVQPDLYKVNEYGVANI